MHLDEAGFARLCVPEVPKNLFEVDALARASGSHRSMTCAVPDEACPAVDFWPPSVRRLYQPFTSHVDQRPIHVAQTTLSPFWGPCCDRR